jgi:hypothetical protein
MKKQFNMEHIDHYNYFHTKYYSKTELLIKNYLIKAKRLKLAFHWAIPQVQVSINEYLENLFKDEFLKKNAKVFRIMWNFYEIDEVEECLNYDMKQSFWLYDNSLTPNDVIKEMEKFNYDFNKYVKGLAIHEVLSEIVKLLVVNSSVLEMHYRLNDFSTFEIKNYGLILLEDTEVYKSLSNRLNPLNDDIEDVTSENLKPNQLSSPQKTLLIEKLISSVDWRNLSERKKANFISIIIDKNATNIRNTLAKSDKKPSENKKEFNDDVTFIENLLKSMA